MKKLFSLVSLTVALIFTPLSANAVVMLQYHHVSDSTPKSTSISPALFEKHLDYLIENQFNLIGLDELAELIRKDKPLPDKTAVVTFDDGYISVHDEAWPLLRERKLPFAVFINTEPHNQGRQGFMSWEQMQAMANAGVVFANHSVSHPHMIRQQDGETKGQWRERMLAEITKAEETIDRQLDQHHKLFAYPFGEFNRELQKLLAKEGYLAFGQQSGPLSGQDHPQALPRFPFGGSYGGLEDFATKVNSRPMPLIWVSAQSEDGVRLGEPLLPKGVKRPRLVMHLENVLKPGQVTCFASGQGRIPGQTAEATLVAQAPKPVPVGRSRYNCTAPTGEAGRFYWFSAMFIRRPDDGGWYSE